MKFNLRVLAPFDKHDIRMHLPEGHRITYKADHFKWMDAERILETPPADITPLSLYHSSVYNFFQNMIPFASQDSDCERRRMGAVITDQSLNLLATGSNVKPDGLRGDCKSIGCAPEVTCRLTTHAESTAFTKLTYHSNYQELRESGLVIFSTAVPCLDCMKLCKANNVKFSVYLEERPQPEYDQPIMSALSLHSGIRFVKVTL